MKIKNEKQQLRESIDELKSLIEWQNIVVNRARKRYDIKKDWLISFWISSDSDTLWFVYEREKSIKNNLEDYLNVLTDRLLKL
jgi:hypothetical protein